jgi:putative endonuclease
MYYVYILECGDGSLYTGMTTDVKRRFHEHKIGRGAKFTKWKKVRALRFVEPQKDRGSALKRELVIKKWPRSKKLASIGARRPKYSR